jgi:hypothetical protein
VGWHQLLYRRTESSRLNGVLNRKAEPILRLCNSHVWTIYIAYKIQGLFAAALTAVLLAFAEVYWAFAFWSSFGPWNSYTLWVASFLVFFGLVTLLDWLSKHADLFGPQKESAD